MMKKQPKPDDILIGTKIRARRVAIGMSQEKLGEAVGVTFQQIQKYEKGTNRVGGSRLMQIAAALKTTAPNRMPLENAEPVDEEAGPSVYAIRLAIQIENLPDKRRAVVADLVRVLSNEATADAAAAA